MGTVTSRRRLVGVLSVLLLAASCTPTRREVVVYTSVDQVFSEPVLREFEQASGIRVRAVYDTEEAKSTGVVNRLIAESENPQADVFWSGDVFRVLVLKRKGVLTPHQAPPGVPSRLRDPEGFWTGFSGRARVLVFDRDRTREPLPRGLGDFTAPDRRGELALANPLFGTTTVHVAALFVALGEEAGAKLFDALRENGVRLVASNSESLKSVLGGQSSFGLTDTDDAFVALQDGRPLGLLFPDQDGPGTLFVPNALARIAKGPNPSEAQRLIDYLLTPEVEESLRQSAGQIPTLPGGKEPEGFPPLSGIRFMDVDYASVARMVEEIRPYLQRWTGM